MKVSQSSMAITFAALLAVTAHGAPHSYRADAIIQSRGQYVLVAVDQYVPRGANVNEPSPDGLVDQTITIGASQASLPTSTYIKGAHVEVSRTAIVVIDQSQRKAFVFSTEDPHRQFPADFVTATANAFQIAVHDRKELLMATVLADGQHTGKKASTLDEFDDPLYPDWWDAINGGGGADRPTCQSGGLGATDCECSFEIATAKAGCKVTCSAGYYACCNQGPNTCKCYSNSNPPR